MSQQELLGQAIRKAGSGRALAQLLERAEPRISLWKSGREPMPDEVVAFLAAYVGSDPIEALAETKGGLWRKLAAASLACVLIAPLLGQNEAAAAPRLSGSGSSGAMCIMSNRLREILRRLYGTSLLRLRTIEPQLEQRTRSASWPTSCAASA